MTPNAKLADAAALPPEAWALLSAGASNAGACSAMMVFVAVSTACCGVWTVPGAMKDRTLHTAPLARAPHASTLVLLGIVTVEVCTATKQV